MFCQILGVDPGWNGGFCLLKLADRQICPETIQLQFWSMPNQYLSLWEFLKEFFSNHTPDRVIIEQVQGFIGKDRPSSRGFRFGENYGAICLGISAFSTYDCVMPHVWMKRLGYRRNQNQTQYQWKTFLKNEAQRITGRSIPQKIADAVLLTLYGATQFGAFFSKLI